MGHDNGGARSWGSTCPFCQQRYAYSNRNRRQAPEGAPWWVNNQHLIACWRRAGSPAALSSDGGPAAG